MKTIVLHALHVHFSFFDISKTLMATKTSLENKHLGNGDYFVIISSSSVASFIVDRARCKWSGRRAIEVNIENERFTVCSRCR